MDSGKMKIAYVITQRAEKKYWNRIGVAFVNHDGSINVKLEAMPVNGEIQIRDYVPREEGLGYLSSRHNGHASDGEQVEVGF